MSGVYLDNNATVPTRADVIQAVTDALHITGNPTAQHAHGREAEALVSRARERVALSMGVCAQDLVFTSGGTEADNTAIWSAMQGGCRHALISAMDHPATYLAVETFAMSHEIIPADGQGRTDMAWLKDRLDRWDDKAHGRPFVSLVAANSETGVIQDVETATELTHAAGGLILVDAVQALGKLSMTYLPDYMAVSAHKIGGPKGVGALYVAPDAPFTPLLSGGGQERRRRSGTHNVAGIAGFGAACDPLTDMSGTAELRDAFETRLKALEPNVVIFGESAFRLPNTSFFAVPDARNMTLMMALDMSGISVSVGTACSSGKTGGSRVLRLMGREADAPQGALRVSFGPDNSAADLDSFFDAWCRVRRISPNEVAA